VEIGVHYIAFWCVFGLCGIQPVEILDFCGNTRKNLMKASKRANTTHFPCRHVSTISDTHISYTNRCPPYQNTTHCLIKLPKIASTTSKHYTFPNQTSQNCVHCNKYQIVHYIKTLHFFPSFVSTISNHYTFPLQTYKNCVHHLQHHTTCVHYIKTLHFS
jgi:hypothetical protein